jgi:DNA-binding protein HU-beta
MAKKPMTKIDIISAIAQKAEVKKNQAKLALDSIVSLIREQALMGNDLRIAGLGTFSPKVSRARVGRNPRTGEPMAIPKRTRMGFKPSKQVKELLNHSPKKEK